MYDIVVSAEVFSVFTASWEVYRPWQPRSKLSEARIRLVRSQVAGGVTQRRQASVLHTPPPALTSPSARQARLAVYNGERSAHPSTYLNLNSPRPSGANSKV